MIYDHSQTYFENLVIGDHFSDHHYAMVCPKSCKSMSQILENLLKYTILSSNLGVWCFCYEILIFPLSKILQEQNIFPWNQKIVGLFWNFFSKLVVFQSSVIADHFTITHEIYDLRSLTIMIWLEMIGDHDPISPTLAKVWWISNKVWGIKIFWKSCNKPKHQIANDFIHQGKDQTLNLMTILSFLEKLF